MMSLDGAFCRFVARNHFLPVTFVQSEIATYETLMYMIDFTLYKSRPAVSNFSNS